MLRTQGGCFLLAALPMYILLYVYMYIPSLFVYSFTNSHRAKRADDEDSTKDWAPYLIPYVVCSIRSTKGKSHSHHTQTLTHITQIVHPPRIHIICNITLLLFFKLKLRERPWSF